MYDWLAGSLRDSHCVLTANRRLARTLTAEYARQKIAAGSLAWRTPALFAWRDWLVTAVAGVAAGPAVPTRISESQSRLLWERCLRREVDDPLLNAALLARQASDTWTRLCEWQVSLERCASEARSRDQRTFAKAALAYRSILQREHWIDPAGLPALATELAGSARLALPQTLSLAGFDRITPQMTALLDALAGSGCRIVRLPQPDLHAAGAMHAFENGAAELRAAGAWARRQLAADGSRRIAIVAPDLADNAARSERLVREGIVPGWQNDPAGSDGIVNVSYGQPLSAYPAVAIALRVLDWAVRDVSAQEFGKLLLSSFVGAGDAAPGCCLELRLRQLPGQSWSPAAAMRAFSGGTDDRISAALELPEALARARAAWTDQQPPSAWAERFDGLLAAVRWPGPKTLQSLEFQLVNRWRELLNEFARLDRILPAMTAGDAQDRLATLAADTVFQPESRDAAVQLLGPLEAAGMEFDSIWIAAATAANWPPPSRPLPLVSRELQREYRMPDASPADTLDYARRVLERLVGSAGHCIVSYPLTLADAEQAPSALLDGFELASGPGPADPGWYASSHPSTAELAVAADPVPAVADGETLAGGAGTIDRHLRDPFSAFASGRLGIRVIPAYSKGLSAAVRGNLLHAGLQRLYTELPDSRELGRWSDQELAARIATAADAAFRRFDRHADPVLRILLDLEKRRAGRLFEQLVGLDRTRGDFAVQAVEQSLPASIGGIALELRIDRIDRIQGDEIMIIDYKTGQPRKLLRSDGDPAEMQLVVYAAAVPQAVGGLCLVNIDSRDVGISQAGRHQTPELDWDAMLARWIALVEKAAQEIAAGDVRVNAHFSNQDARPLGLLSRFQELSRAR